MRSAHGALVAAGVLAIVLLVLRRPTSERESGLAPREVGALRAPSVDLARPASAPEGDARRPFAATREVPISASESPAGTQEPREPEPAEEWTVALVGRVVDEGGAPIEGAELQTEDGIVRARSDHEGHVQPLPGSSSPWPKRALDDATTLHVCAHGRTSRLLSVWVQDGATLHLGTLVLGRGADILGVVRDPRGRPLANAMVRLYDVEEWSFDEGSPRYHEIHSDPTLQSTFSDPEGSFRLSGAPAGEVFVTAWAEGRQATWTQPFVLRAGEDAHLDLTLESDGKRRARWTIRVLDPRGAPVSRALVTAVSIPFSGWQRPLTDEPGRVDLDLLVGQEIRVMATDGEERWRSSPAELRMVGEDASFDLLLREPSYLSVAVTDEEGRPVPGSSVWIGQEDLDPAMLPTDALGVARILLPSGPFRIQGFAPGFSYRSLGPFDPATVAVEEPLVLRLSPGRAVRGIVRAAGGSVAQAAIALRKNEADKVLLSSEITSTETPFLLTSSRCDGETTTDAAGAFVLNVWEDGWYTVIVEARGFPVQSFGPFEVRGTAGPHHELALQLGGTIEGRLVPSPDTSAAGRVVGAFGDAGFAITTAVGEDGRYRIDGLAPGGYQVRECHPPVARLHPIRFEQRAGDRRELTIDCVVREGSTTSFDLDLSTTGSVVLEGSFRAAGLETEWATILREGEERECAGVEIDSDGRFRFSLSRPGPYRIRIPTESDFSMRGTFEAPVRLSAGIQRWSVVLSMGHVSVLGGSSATEDFDLAESVVLAWRNDVGATYWTDVFLEEEQQTLPFPAGRVQAIVDEGNRRELDVAAGETVVLDLTR